MSLARTSPTKATCGVAIVSTSRRFAVLANEPTTGSDEGNSSRDFCMNSMAVHHCQYQAPTISGELQDDMRIALRCLVNLDNLHSREE